MVHIGKQLNKDVRAEITNMEQPLGKMIGNKNEIIEAMESLKGNGEKKLMELIYSSGITMLMQAKLVENQSAGKELIDHVITSQKALNKFFEMVKNQGGDDQIIQKEN